MVETSSIQDQMLAQNNALLTKEDMRFIMASLALRDQTKRNVRKPFTSKEDARLLQMVALHGTTDWRRVAEGIPGRTPRQCRERYRSKVDPSLNNSPWTPEEDSVLLQKHDEYGPRWSLISQFLPGRSPSNVKNRWYKKLKKQNDAFESEVKMSPFFSDELEICDDFLMVPVNWC